MFEWKEKSFQILVIVDYAAELTEMDKKGQRFFFESSARQLSAFDRTELELVS